MRGLGAALLMLSSLSIGLFSLQEKRRHIKCLRELAEALSWMAGELREKALPLPELIRRIAKGSDGFANSFFSALEEGLPLLGEKSLSELWNEAVEHLTCLAEEERRELNVPGRQLGHTELSGQITALDNVCRYLNTKRENEERGLRNDQKLRLCLPMAVGAFLLILLL